MYMYVHVSADSVALVPGLPHYASDGKARAKATDSCFSFWCARSQSNKFHRLLLSTCRVY